MPQQQQSQFAREHQGYTCETKHIKFKMNGSIPARAAFNYIAGRRDPDWPWAPLFIRKDRVNNDPRISQCAKCQGFIYRQALMTPDELARLGKQIHDSKEIPGTLRVKVKGYHRATDCGAASEAIKLSDMIPGDDGGYIAGSC